MTTLRALMGAVIALAAGCDEYGVTVVDMGCSDADGDGILWCELPWDGQDACPYHPAPDLTVPHVTGQVLCAAPDAGGATDVPLPYLPVHGRFGEATTDCFGTYVFPVGDAAALVDGPVDVGYFFDHTLPAGASTGTRLRVMDDLEAAWGASPTHVGFFQTRHGTVDRSGPVPVLRLDPMVLETSECEAWRVGTEIVTDYHDTVGEGVPRGRLQFMRRAAVFGTAPYAFYDHVDLASNFLDLFPGRTDREATLYHEASHVVRDVADGDEGHWHGDNVN